MKNLYNNYVTNIQNFHIKKNVFVYSFKIVSFQKYLFIKHYIIILRVDIFIQSIKIKIYIKNIN